MPLMIRLGDTTSHGGTVLEGFPVYVVEGRPVAGLGHKVACPKCKGVFPIVEGNPSHTFNQIPLAYAGMKTACGASLLPSQASTVHSTMTGHNTQLPPEQLPISPLAQQPDERVVQFKLRHHETREPLAGVPYTIKLSNGGQETGHSDSNGLTAPLLVKKTIEASLVVQSAP